MTHVVADKRNSDSEGREGVRTPPPPPDGGWGWMVVFASFMIHIVTDGMTYSFGIFYVEFLDYFNEGKGYTAWIVSILAGVTLCSGPISSVFVNWYGCRIVTMVGAVLATICIIISVFAPNVLTLFFTIGVGTGLGFGLIYLPAIVSVTVYFEKYRSLATGIAVCGSGIGTFLFAPLTETLITNYGWRGAMLIVSSLVLNCVIFGAMFRPLENEIPDDYIEPPTEMTLLSVGQTDKHSSHVDVSTTHKIENGNGNGNGNEITRAQSIDQMRQKLLVHPHVRPNGQANGKFRPDTETARLALSQPMLNRTIENNKTQRSQSLKRIGSGIMYRPDVLYQGSLQQLHKSSNAIPEEYKLMGRRGSKSSDKSYCPPPNGLPTTQDFRNTISDLIDLSLLTDPIFIIFTLSNFLTSIGFYIPYVYIVAQAEELGMAKDKSSYLLSIIGIANSVGRIVLGYISDKPWVNRLGVYNVCLTVCGASTILSVFCNDFYSLGVYASVFGFTIGAYVGLTSVILVDLLGLEKLTDAFGLLLLFQGFASIIGSPVAGMLYDSLKSYHPGFYVSGFTILISGLMLFSIPPLQRYQERRSKNPVVVFTDI